MVLFTIERRKAGNFVKYRKEKVTQKKRGRMPLEFRLKLKGVGQRPAQQRQTRTHIPKQD